MPELEGFTTKQIKEIFAIFKDVMATKDVATHNAATLLHGPGGIFNGAGLDNAVLSTHVRPMGIGPTLPAFPSFDTNPQFATLTGISDDEGDEPTDVCADAPTGYMKGAYLTARFGRVIRDTETMEPGQMLMKLHRGDFTDLMFYGQILQSENQGTLYPSDLDESGFIDLVTKAQMVMTGARMERKLSKLVWQGDPANNVGEGYKEFPGFDQQIQTGQVDAETGAVAPSLDPLIVDANYGAVGTYDIVGEIQGAEYFSSELAEETMGAVDGVIAMRPQLWNEISNVWPIQYNTDPAAYMLNTTAGRLMVDGTQMVRERDLMRSSKQITINGKTYQVVTDTGIYEANSTNDANLAPGEFASPIYYLPLKTANLPLTYWQYVDWRGATPETALLQNMQSFWSDSGRFLWGLESAYAWCYKLKMRTEPRIILRTPQLAWKIDNVKYVPKHHLRDADPSSSYWVNGGVSLRSTPSQSAVWL